MKYLLYLIPVLILTDLALKKLAWEYLHKKIHLVWDWVYLEFVKNTGVAFSFAVEGIFLKIVTLVLIFGIIYYYVKEEYKKKHILVDIAFVLVISWAIGNAYERIFFWEVIDFIWVKYFAVFNFADICISAWFWLYLFSLIFRKK